MKKKHQTQVERFTTFAEFMNRLEEDNIKIVKAIHYGSSMAYRTEGKIVSLPVKDVVFTAYKVGETEDEDRIYRYVVRISEWPKYPDVSNKDDFKNFKEVVKTLRDLQIEGYQLYFGEWGRPLEEKPDEYFIEWNRER